MKPAYAPLAAAALGLAVLEARAASLSELLRQVPAPPKSAAAALGWMHSGEIVAPEYTQFKKAIEAERADIAALNGGSYPASGAAPAAPAGEPGEVMAAVQSYTSYLADNSGKSEPAAVLGKRTRWLQAAMGGQLKTLMDRLTPCANPCLDAAVAARNQPVLARKRQLADQDVQQWTVLFEDWKRGRTPVVDAGQARIAAAGEGAKAVTPQGKAALAQYRAAMLKEVELTLSITELAVKRADAIEHGSPDAVSGSTKSAKKAS